jgi:hypothetical protein
MRVSQCRSYLLVYLVVLPEKVTDILLEERSPQISFVITEDPLNKFLGAN